MSRTGWAQLVGHRLATLPHLGQIEVTLTGE